MIQVCCETCGKQFWVKGHSTPNSYTEPGETIINENYESEDMCNCYKNGASFTILNEETETFEDDVI